MWRAKRTALIVVLIVVAFQAPGVCAEEAPTSAPSVRIEKAGGRTEVFGRDGLYWMIRRDRASGQVVEMILANLQPTFKDGKTTFKRASGSTISFAENKGLTLLCEGSSTFRQQMKRLPVIDEDLPERYRAAVTANPKLGLLQFLSGIEAMKEATAFFTEAPVLPAPASKPATQPAASKATEESALHGAIRRDELAAAERALADGADVNLKNNVGEAPLQSAIRVDRGSFVKLLLAKGADVNAKNSVGETPLHSAIRLDRTSITEQLVAAGADLNLKNDAGETPLHSAIRLDRESILRLLVSKGADIGVKNSVGETALQSAKRLQRGTAVEILEGATKQVE